MLIRFHYEYYFDFVFLSGVWENANRLIAHFLNFLQNLIGPMLSECVVVE